MVLKLVNISFRQYVYCFGSVPSNNRKYYRIPSYFTLLQVTRLKVTPHDTRTAESMNHYSGDGCGKAHAWKAGQEQDVTWTGGCVTLGIRLPNMERDIMRMEVVRRKLYLYVGQRLVDRKPGTAYQMERPTAFQVRFFFAQIHDLSFGDFYCSRLKSISLFINRENSSHVTTND